MSLLRSLRESIPDTHPLRLLYYKFIAFLAALWYGFPASKLRVIAITGTKGKSTVTHMLAAILMEAGFNVGVASTIHFQIKDRVWPNDTKQTTQGRFRLQRLLRQMVSERCDFAILEVTSHALVQSRLWGINIDVAVLTNIQRDHLEYHGGFENYMHAKGLLFSQLARGERKWGHQKAAILPVEDANFAYFDSFPVDRKITYGLSKGEVHGSDIHSHASGEEFLLNVPNSHTTVKLPLPGEFNVHNALAAAAAALVCGVNASVIAKGLRERVAIPGRLETINCGQPFTVVVDYAHTVESLQKVLSLFKSLTKGRLWVVFGATGGGRDKSKRPEMGAAADRYADMIIVTDDDPYTEDRMTIIEQIAAGIQRTEGEGLWLIRDRREAIKTALLLAAPGDTVIIAGKGCEPIQIIGEERIEWDDRKVAREILSTPLQVNL